MRIVTLTLLSLLMFAACAIKRPIVSEVAQNNKDFTVEYLFEHEGCKVYRFLDQTAHGTYYVYYTNCSGDAIARTDSTAIKNSIRVTHPGN